ncbi:MAG TPA: choice-of-anchor tandem repeat GloVer-containing protein [Rhizomicrobium sp.]
MNKFTQIAMVAAIFPIVVPSSHVFAATESVIYSFQGGADGANPQGELTEKNGTFYGVTEFGGGGNNPACNASCGTVYALHPQTGAESVMHVFGKGSDGWSPYAGLTAAKGMLYGTTNLGGSNTTGDCEFVGCGTVYSINMGSGEESVIYSFQGFPGDAESPESSLTNIKGTLYGTSSAGRGNDKQGCPSGCGTVFLMQLQTGSERVIHSFYSDGRGGRDPQARLTYAGGILYGTTSSGGSDNVGTLFSIDIRKSNRMRVIHTFGSKGGDGAEPYAGVIDVNGTLYGTTEWGGTYGYGTVYAIDAKAGTETILHSFNDNRQDGFNPTADLLELNGVLYGTTPYGGLNSAGTVYSIDLATGIETIIYSFCVTDGCADGETPYSGLTNIKGRLYGTTYSGGARDAGTVYAISLKD